MPKASPRRTSKGPNAGAPNKRKRKDDGIDVYVDTQPYDEALSKASVSRIRTRSVGASRATKFAPWIVLAIIALPSAFNYAQGRGLKSRQAEVTSMGEVLYSPMFKVRYPDRGASVIRSWYAGGSQNIRVTNGISWPMVSVAATADSGAVVRIDNRNVAFPKVTEVSFLRGTQILVPGADKSTVKERLEYLAVVDGVQRKIAIEIGIGDLDDRTEEPVLLSPPTLMLAPDLKKPVKTDFTPSRDLDSIGKPSETLQLQVQQWARAWSTNDVSALKQLTQDSDNSRAYIGFDQGWSHKEGTLNIRWGYARSGDLAELRVNFVMVNGVTDTENYQEMDILVKGWDTGLPAIVAWGPPGVSNLLVPYENATSNAFAKGTKQGSIGDDDGSIGSDDDQTLIPDDSTPGSTLPSEDPADTVIGN